MFFFLENLSIRCGDFLLKQQQAGKGIILCRGCTREDDEGLCGRIEREIPFIQGGDTSGDNKNMVKTYPTHSILNGVEKFNGGVYSARARIKGNIVSLIKHLIFNFIN